MYVYRKYSGTWLEMESLRKEVMRSQKLNCSKTGFFLNERLLRKMSLPKNQRVGANWLHTNNHKVRVRHLCMWRIKTKMRLQDGAEKARSMYRPLKIRKCVLQTSSTITTYQENFSRIVYQQKGRQTWSMIFQAQTQRVDIVVNHPFSLKSITVITLSSIIEKS